MLGFIAVIIKINELVGGAVLGIFLNNPNKYLKLFIGWLVMSSIHYFLFKNSDLEVLILIFGILTLIGGFLDSD